MPLNLPTPETGQLKHSPLDLVVCQIRFEKQVAVSDARVAKKFFDRLNRDGDTYKQIDEATASNNEIVIGPQGPVSANQTQLPGWRLPGHEEGWAAVLFPSHVALETVSYRTWDDPFKPRLNDLVEAVAEVIDPAFEQRVGLRYIDRIHQPSLSTAAEWAKYIRAEFAGPLANGNLGGSVVGAHQQLVIEVDEDVNCQMRHGTLYNEETNSHDYLIDCDISRSGGRSFDVESIMEQLETFHTSALQLFQAVANDELMQELRGDSE